MEWREMCYAGHVARMGKSSSAYRVLETRGKKPHERPTRRWENTIKTSLKSWMGGMDLIDLAKNRDRWRAFVKAVMKIPLP
jgi:hypothetical protein